MPEHGMNETAGRTSAYEPSPPSMDAVWCKLKEQRVNVTEARASYQSHRDTCIDCQECQAG